jgi:hypothetical protein
VYHELYHYNLWVSVSHKLGQTFILFLVYTWSLVVWKLWEIEVPRATYSHTWPHSLSLWSINFLNFWRRKHVVLVEHIIVLLLLPLSLEISIKCMFLCFLAFLQKEKKIKLYKVHLINWLLSAFGLSRFWN